MTGNVNFLNEIDIGPFSYKYIMEYYLLNNIIPSEEQNVCEARSKRRILSTDRQTNLNIYERERWPNCQAIASNAGLSKTVSQKLTVTYPHPVTTAFSLAFTELE